MKKWFKILILLTLVLSTISFLTTFKIASQPPETPAATAITQENNPQQSPPSKYQSAPLISTLRSKNYHSQLVKEKIVEQTTTYQAWLTHFTADSLKEFGLLIIPQGEMPSAGWPTIILVHGYVQPESYRVNGTPYHHWWQALVNQGQFAVFKPDLRGHDQSEGQPASTYYDYAYVSDLLYAYHALQTDPLIDADKIGLWSHSSAGNLVLRSAAIAQNIPAISIWGGAIYTYEDFCQWGQTDGSKIPNPQAWLTNLETSEKSFYQLINRHLQGDCHNDLEFWRAFAPTNHLDEVTTAFQIQHSHTDETINYSYAQNLHDILQAANLEVKLVSYPQGDHNFNHILPQAITAMTDFFSTKLAVSSPTPLL
jgi:dipeptidyl aminopeptidase/acylaminoacyl peptidase